MVGRDYQQGCQCFHGREVPYSYCSRFIFLITLLYFIQLTILSISVTKSITQTQTRQVTIRTAERLPVPELPLTLDKNISKIAKMVDSKSIVLCSAISEVFLRKLAKQGFIRYTEGSEFVDTREDLLEMGEADGGGLKEMDEKLKTQVTDLAPSSEAGLF